MSHTEAMSCKLPLLDGEDVARVRLLETELELESFDCLQEFGEKDVTSFNDLLCTAWGLLLRCYTGQDDISFHFRQINADDVLPTPDVHLNNPSVFRMAFDEHETLSTCFAKAKDGYSPNSPNESVVSTVSDSSSSSAAGNQNTHVFIRDSTRKITQDIVVQKVL